MINKLAIGFCLLISSVMTAHSADFMDTTSPKRIITAGVRLGITNSTQGMNLEQTYANIKQANIDWGTGFELGAVVNLNIRNYFTLQPGFFFQNKSYDVTLIESNFNAGELTNSFEHSRFYYFQIPILASFRFNLSNDIQWTADFGPYFGFGLGGNTKVETYSTKVSDTGVSSIEYYDYKHDFFGDSDGKNILMKNFDWGFKMGSSLIFKKHYSFGVYYNAGCKNVANDHPGFVKSPTAKNKQWTFTLGYDF